MITPFINRKEELVILNKAVKKAKLIVIFGRRRIGKTRLIAHWGKNYPVLYSQAIEGSENLQVEQIYNDIREHLPVNYVPKNWTEFFEILALVRKKIILVLDEFPYLVLTNPALPSIFQKWLDHKQPENVKFIILGSAQTMMHGLFLNGSSPLFERANRILHLKPMAYKHFAAATGLNPRQKSSFLKYSLVGGVPKYWEYASVNQNSADLAEELYFSDFPILDSEPFRLLKDDNINSLHAMSILEAIGRGSSRPSEIAGRLEIAQTSMHRPFQVLMDANLISREIPFGESSRSTKRFLYKIIDYPLSFWYNVYSPHRSRWSHYAQAKKELLIAEHASKILEMEFRKLYVESARYWENPDIEFDSIRSSSQSSKELIITEIKWKNVSIKEREKLRFAIEYKFQNSRLSKKYNLADIEILSCEEILSLIIKRDK